MSQKNNSLPLQSTIIFASAVAVLAAKKQSLGEVMSASHQPVNNYFLRIKTTSLEPVWYVLRFLLLAIC